MLKSLAAILICCAVWGFIGAPIAATVHTLFADIAAATAHANAISSHATARR